MLSLRSSRIICVSVLIAFLQSSFVYPSSQANCITAKIIPVTPQEIDAKQLTDTFQTDFEECRRNLKIEYNKMISQRFKEIYSGRGIGFSTFFINYNARVDLMNDNDHMETDYKASASRESGFLFEAYWGREEWRTQLKFESAETFDELWEVDNTFITPDMRMDHLKELEGRLDTRPRLFMYGWGQGDYLGLADVTRPVKLTTLDNGNYIVFEAEKGESYGFQLLRRNEDQNHNVSFEIMNEWVDIPVAETSDYYQFVMAKDKKGFSMFSVAGDGATIVERTFSLENNSFNKGEVIEISINDPAISDQLRGEWKYIGDQMQIVDDMIKRQKEREEAREKFADSKGVELSYEAVKNEKREVLSGAVYIGKYENKELEDAVNEVLGSAKSDFLKRYFSDNKDAITYRLDKDENITYIKEAICPLSEKIIVAKEQASDLAQEIFLCKDADQKSIKKVICDRSEIKGLGISDKQADTLAKKILKAKIVNKEGLEQVILEFLEEIRVYKQQADYLIEELYLYCHSREDDMAEGIKEFLCGKLAEAADKMIANAKTTEEKEKYEVAKDEKMRALLAILEISEAAQFKDDERFKTLKEYLGDTKAAFVSQEGKETIEEFSANTEPESYGDIVILPKNAELFVFGDIHADSLSLARNIKNVRARMKKGANIYAVFTGDYVNNGLDSIGSLEQILSFQKEFRENVILLNGNHEFRETYGTVVKEYFFTHWNNALDDKDYKALGLKQPPFDHYGHIRFELIEKFGFTRGEELYKQFEEWGRRLPYMAMTADGILMSHSLGLSKELNKAVEAGRNLTLRDLCNVKAADSEFIKRVGYEAWKKLLADSQHASMVNNRKNIPAIIEKFKEIGAWVFLFGHTHYRSGEIMPGTNVVTLCSSDKESPTAGHYMRQEMDNERAEVVVQNAEKYDPLVDVNNKEPIRASYAWFPNGYAGTLDAKKNIYTLNQTPDYARVFEEIYLEAA
jgi:hypothetical protein